MLRAFVDLTLWSVKNRLRTRLRRLREPRYAVGLAIGVAWLGYYVFAPLLRTRGSGGQHVETPMELFRAHIETAQLGTALLLLTIALVIAVLPGERHPLVFTPAEQQFLFPAPITRRQLLHYKLVRSQGALLLSAALTTLILRPATLRDGWMLSVGFWLVLAVGRMFAIAVGLGRETAARRGAAAGRPSWVLVAISAAVVAVLAIAVLANRNQLGAPATITELIETPRRIWSSRPCRAVLWPFVTLASLPLSQSPAAFWSRFPAALLILGACYVQVMRAGVPFEEKAAAQSGAKSTPQPKLSRRAARGARAPFPLAPTGRPETAILWKNLILLGRYASLSTVLKLLPFLLLIPLAAMTSKSGSVAMMLLVLSMMVGFLAVVVGPLVARNDVRQDMSRLALLKSWPVSGAAIVRGELLAPALVVSVMVWLAILLAAITIGFAPVRGGMKVALLSHLVPYTAAALLAAPAVIVAQLVVHNGIALLFPAWTFTGRDRGVEASGQMLLTMVGGYFAAGVLLVLPALVAGLMMLLLWALTRVRALVVVVPAGVFLALLLAEAALVVRWLGRVFERTDLSAVDPQE